MSNLGMAQRMLEISIKRANDRVTFGKPIASRQMIKAKIADMQMMVHVLRTAMRDQHFGRRIFDIDPQRVHHREGGYLQALLHPYVKLVSDERWKSSVATVTSKIPRMARPSVCTATAAPCGLNRVLLASSASPSPVRPRTTVALSSTTSNPHCCSLPSFRA